MKMSIYPSAATALAFVLLLSFTDSSTATELRFNSNGQFKIVQVADMHYADGATTKCLDVLPEQMATCSDLNTTAFLNRMIELEKPDLLVFTGDNIFQADSSNATASLLAAFAPAIDAKIPWAAVLGNHDQEPASAGILNRSQVMDFIVKMPYSVSQMNPQFQLGNQPTIEGFGNYYLQVFGALGSALETKSVLNLYFIDSGDYAAFQEVSYYDWIKSSQQVWLQQVSAKLQAEYKSAPVPQSKAAPALGFHHIPIPETLVINQSEIVGVRMETDGSPKIDSGFVTTLVTMGDVKAVFMGHNHLDEYCGNLAGTYQCFAGGFGYHAYGLAGWDRRSRVITTFLGGSAGSWEDVQSIQTHKRLDDANFTQIDQQALYLQASLPVSTAPKKRVE